MGLTYITARVANPARPHKSARLRFLVDSGAAYSIVPEPVLKRLGIKPRTVRRFILADGAEIKRRMGGALFLYQGEEGLSPVIFGEEGDSSLLGIVSLEALGFIFDPLRRELRPMPMVLGPVRWCPEPEVRVTDRFSLAQAFTPGKREPHLPEPLFKGLGGAASATIGDRA